ncbi:hypothetical protein ACSX1A_15715 [Pontibacter sp. MBLB2868]|uniref:hypothetical protein n=1 Tax=Pontibacter sp. MBLB2868 TaxID=3451555 RepID=UPI003F7507DB
MSASRVSGDERERGSPRHEGRKGKQRDAARRGLPARRAPKLEMKKGKRKTADQQQLKRIAELVIVAVVNTTIKN